MTQDTETDRSGGIEQTTPSGTTGWPVVPEQYGASEGPVLVDEWWHWSVLKSLVATVFIGLGSVAWGSGAVGLGQLLVLVGIAWYGLSPSVQGPITS